MVVTDQLPYPPRNGITLPVSNYIEQLRRTHRVSLCLLQPAGAQDSGASLAENEARYGPVTRIALRRQTRGLRLVDELRGAEMYQHGWQFDAGGQADAAHAVAAAEGAALLVSPISAVAKWRAVRSALPSGRARAMVAAVNDCTAAEYRYRLRAAQPHAAARLKAWSDAWRVPWVARIEAALLADYDRVLLQTDADLRAMRELVGPATAARCVLAPNGVRADLFDLTPVPGEQVLFVAELSGEYGPLVEWLCTQVWPLVRAACPQAGFTVIGRGASPVLRRCMAATAGLQHHEFAPDLAGHYATAGLAWSPLFKGFGLINKTLEAMASALPVVGGQAAFNGIAGFIDGVHGLGLPAPDAQRLAAATVSLLQSPPRRRQMGDAARELVRGQFSWERSAELIRQTCAAPPLPPDPARPASARAPAQRD